ncbi:uncharacterized protein LOC131269583 isoform X2 [Anopheles coustani]|uniref:uncharacterized protein LOC131269583 isoform X2 n=1 Tax=Anopheles coustani TaxID=139045 RepID=UPI002658FCB5|nr:uncharacterized protein LOC131269583 isoform X2 [Anopheles coustani]
MSGATSDVFEDHLVDESSQYMLDDLQLAAELGKTLLERNKELEASLKHHQNVIDDHVQEIEYLTKQNAALREVNDSRMKIYEQLEVSIQDLERDKYKLALDYQAEKKHVKQLCCNIESLETKVEELSRSLEDARRQVEAERRSKQTERLAGAQPPVPQLTFSLVTPPSKDAKCSTVHANTSNTATSPTQGGHGDGPDSRQATESCQKPNVSTPKSKPAANGPEEAHHPTGGGGSAEDAPVDAAVDEYHMCEESEEMLRMAQELQQTQRCLLSEQSKVGELEEQLASIAQENQLLQSKLVHANTAEDMKSVHDELSVLAEFRQGQVCTRCMRGFDDQPDTDSIITGTEDDDTSLLELINNTETPRMYCSSVTLEIAPPKPDSLDLSLSDCAGPTNPYRELVEKYEALLEVHRQPMMRKASQGATMAVVAGSGNNTPVDSCQPQQLLPPVVEGGAAGLQQQDEQQPHQPRYMIEFNPPTVVSRAGGDGRAGGADAMEGSDNRTGGQSTVGARAVGGSEYSEAETASSGYSDEVSNKATQTDESPKNFLCTIADGKDWRFSIYEDPSAIDSRFRFSPSHRELFREIFSVLKKAAENRDEGDQLPLLDDAKPLVGAGKPAATSVPPVTPANEEPPGGFPDQEQEQDDDTVSFISSSAVSEQSLAMSECITKSERRRIARQAKCAAAAASRGYMGEEENRPPLEQQQQQQQQHVLPDGRVLIPYKQQPLEYISVTVGKRKSRRRSHREPGTPQSGAAATPPRPPSSSGRKHRPSFRPWNPDTDATTPTGAEWNGNSMTVYNRSRGSSGAPPPHTPTSATPVGAKGGRTRSRTSKSRDKQQRHAIADLATSHNRYAELAADGDATAAAVGGGGGGGGDDLVVEFKPSTASQHLHKLQKLDLSYAEVLRRADTCQPYNTRRQQTRQQQHHNY